MDMKDNHMKAELLTPLGNQFPPGHRKHAKGLFCLAALLSFWPLVEPAACFAQCVNDGSGTVLLQGGALNGVDLGSTAWELTALRGASITGSVQCATFNTMDANAVAPFGYTWTWGARTSSIISISDWIPVGSSSWTVPIDLTAPTNPGIYYLLFGFSGEYTAEQVLSCDNWAAGGSIRWNDRNDYWDLDATRLAFAHTNGYAYLWPYRRASGAEEYALTAIPVLPIKIIVPDSGMIYLTGGSLVGVGLGSTNSTIVVAPGSSLTGSVECVTRNLLDAGSVAPFGYTWTWGNRSNDMVEVDGWIPTGSNNLSVPINLQSPTNPGTYYLLFGFNGEFNLSQVFSCQNWSCVAPIDWQDGNDYFDMDPTRLAYASTNGYVADWPYRYGPSTSGSDYERRSTVPVLPIKVVVPGTNHGSGSIFLTGGSLTGTPLGGGSCTVRVPPGGSITGSVQCITYNTMGPNAVAPFGYTWTWGNRSNDMVEVNGWIPTGSNSWTVPINLRAPLTEGTYSLLFGFDGEYDLSQVLSCHNWASGAPIAWGDGNDYFDLDPLRLAYAGTNGYAYNWRYRTGPTTNDYTLTDIPVAAIKVVVGRARLGVAPKCGYTVVTWPAAYRSATLQSCTLVRGGTWSDQATPSCQAGDNCEYYQPCTNSAEFFRLKFP
jgi:hypothetical protein